jgi:hypothetical protein
MAGIFRDSKNIKLKGYPFNSVNGVASIDLQQPGDCNTLVGINIYRTDGSDTAGQTFSLTINSQLILDGINADEANPVVNNSAKSFLPINYPLAGSDSIKLQWKDTAVATYVANIYYYY